MSRLKLPSSFNPWLLNLSFPLTGSLAPVEVANVASPRRRGPADNNMPRAPRNLDPALLEELEHGGLPCTGSLLDAVHLHDVLQHQSSHRRSLLGRSSTILSQNSWHHVHKVYDVQVAPLRPRCTLRQHSPDHQAHRHSPWRPGQPPSHRRG